VDERHQEQEQQILVVELHEKLIAILLVNSEEIKKLNLFTRISFSKFSINKYVSFYIKRDNFR
jgi:hypothetical protein